MIRPTLVVRFILWAVIAGPVLCTAGLLAHPCACEDERACDHETTCEADPCRELLVHKDESHADAPHAAPSSETLVDAAGCRKARSHAVLAPASDRLPPPGLPRASDHPLLI